MLRPRAQEPLALGLRRERRAGAGSKAQAKAAPGNRKLGLRAPGGQRTRLEKSSAGREGGSADLSAGRQRRGPGVTGPKPVRKRVGGDPRSQREILRVLNRGWNEKGEAGPGWCNPHHRQLLFGVLRPRGRGRNSRGLQPGL